jgi:hypothetical protein
MNNIGFSVKRRQHLSRRIEFDVKVKNQSNQIVSPIHGEVKSDA